MPNMFWKATGMDVGDLVYVRQASTLANPVPANTSNFVIINFVVPANREQLLLYAIGSDQHANSVYTWIVDGQTLAVSGTAKPGGIYDPLIFPEPLKVQNSVLFMVQNDNANPFPTLVGPPANQIPYEGVIIGRWA